MVEELIVGGVYQHYKGKNYIILGIARHSETLEEMVLYECLYQNELGSTWVRPLKMFLEKISLEGRDVPRFRYIGNEKGKNRF